MDGLGCRTSRSRPTPKTHLHAADRNRRCATKNRLPCLLSFVDDPSMPSIAMCSRFLIEFALSTECCPLWRWGSVQFYAHEPRTRATASCGFGRYDSPQGRCGRPDSKECMASLLLRLRGQPSTRDVEQVRLCCSCLWIAVALTGRRSSSRLKRKTTSPAQKRCKTCSRPSELLVSCPTRS